MRRASSIQDVEALIQQAKAGATAYCTNFYPVAAKLQAWIAHAELFCDWCEGTALFYRADRGFWHLYYCAPEFAALQRCLGCLPLLRSDGVVLDLVGKEPDLDALAELLKSSGLRLYQRLFRMSRTVAPMVPTIAPEPDARLSPAAPSDCPRLLELLLTAFDPRAEQIPRLYELQAAVAAGQIHVVRSGTQLAGLLFAETQGVTSLLRYWMVVPEFRSQRLGALLMQRFLYGQASVRRSLLWVVATNHDAILKYRHYGFVAEGLVDYVLANDKIPA